MLKKIMLAGALSLTFTCLAQAQNISDYRPIYKSMVEKHGNAIVTVKFVMAINSAGKEQRIEDRTQAVLVSKDGLLLVPDRAVSFDFSAMSGVTLSFDNVTGHGRRVFVFLRSSDQKSIVVVDRCCKILDKVFGF